MDVKKNKIQDVTILKKKRKYGDIDMISVD